MKLIRSPGVTGEIWTVFIQNSSVSDGSGLTGLSNSSSGLICYYHRDTDTTPTAVSLVNMTLGTYTSGGFKVISDSFMPGFYQFCPPNAALASGAKSVAFSLSGAANMAQVPIEIDMQAGADISNDVWNVMLPGSYAIGTAGYILGHLTDADIADAVWSVSLPGAYTLPQAGARMVQAYNALEVDAHAEPVTVPAANATLQHKLDWLYMLARNKITQTDATQSLFNDGGGSIIAAAVVSDDGTLFTRSQFA